MVGTALVVHGFVLRLLEATVDTLRNNLIKRATNLLLRLIIVDHALSVRLARCAQVILVVPTVARSTLRRQHRVLEAVLVRDRLHEVVVLRGQVVVLAGGVCGVLQAAGLLSHFLNASLGRSAYIGAVRGVNRFHVLGNNLILALLPVQ